MGAPGRRSRAWLAGAALTALLPVVAGCGEGDGATTTSSTTSTTAGGAFAASGGCPMIPPGQVMSAAEATIRFSVDRVCPGYVTVPVGTTVQVRNESTKSARFRVHEGPDGTGALVFDQRLEAGGEASITFDRSGFNVYTTSLLPSFKGTIEVVGT